MDSTSPMELELSCVLCHLVIFFLRSWFFSRPSSSLHQRPTRTSPRRPFHTCKADAGTAVVETSTKHLHRSQSCLPPTTLHTHPLCSSFTTHRPPMRGVHRFPRILSGTTFQHYRYLLCCSIHPPSIRAATPTPHRIESHRLVSFRCALRGRWSYFSTTYAPLQLTTTHLATITSNTLTQSAWRPDSDRHCRSATRILCFPAPLPPGKR